MGIQHLYSYTYNINKFYYTIDIKSEIDKYRKKYNKKPVIIIDSISIHALVYTNTKEKLLGGRFHLYNDRAHQIFQTFIDLGCEIILISDGQLFPDKISTYVNRYNAKYIKNLKITHAIDSNNMDELLNNLDPPDLTPFFSNFRSIGKKYGKVIRTIREGDQDMVWLANQTNALAILSDDSDFLIFDGNWQYWNAKDLNLDRSTVTVYDKAALKSHLSLTSEQMILFATLSGNDFLKYEQLENFHQGIARYQKFRPYANKFTEKVSHKFKEISKIVSKVKSSPYKLNRDDENYLLNMIFGHNQANKEAALNNFRQSIQFYCDAKLEGKEHSSELLKEASKSVFTYAMIVDFPEKFSFVFDLSSDDFTPYYQLIRPFICRAMGIILKHNENVENLTRTFYAKSSRSEDFKAHIEKPIFPPYDLPPLLELITKPLGENAELDNLRMKLLCWNISLKVNSKLTPEIILSLPEEHVSTILVLYVLVERKQILIEEADCLLFANVADSSVKNSINLNHINRIDGRAFRIAFLFTRLFQIIGQPIKILGLSKYNSLIVFDGLFYHYLTQNWNKAKFTNNLNKLQEQYKTLRIYATDFNLVN